MVLTPLFYIIALLATGNKLVSIARDLRTHNREKLKSDFLFLGLMILTIILTHIAAGAWLPADK